jgi:hypothetical protein
LCLTRVPVDINIVSLSTIIRYDFMNEPEQIM